VEHWDLRTIETPEGSRSPVVLHSGAAARAVLIRLGPGQELGDHQVKENAFVLVLEGEAQVEAGASARAAGSGELFAFAPDETRRISTRSGARLLLFLAPWPGEGHYRGEKRDLA
jgi:quercetin dioxygenase-like cupin family protein